MRRRAVVATDPAPVGLRARAAVEAIEAVRIRRSNGDSRRLATFARNGTAIACREGARLLRRELEMIGKPVRIAAQFLGDESGCLDCRRARSHP